MLHVSIICLLCMSWWGRRHDTGGMCASMTWQKCVSTHSESQLPALGVGAVRDAAPDKPGPLWAGSGPGAQQGHRPPQLAASRGSTQPKAAGRDLPSLATATCIKGGEMPFPASWTNGSDAQRNKPCRYVCIVSQVSAWEVR